VVPEYQLSLGDSLTQGWGASTLTSDFANLIRDHESSTYPDLQVQNIACLGETTTSFQGGGGVCSYAHGNQLAQAEWFLAQHPGHVAYITLDLGINDVDGCFQGDVIDMACTATGVADVQHDLPQIVAGLQAAAPGVPIFGANSYDPYLAGAPEVGASDPYLGYQSLDPSFAPDSLTVFSSLNSAISAAYSTPGVTIVDVASAFQTQNAALTGSFEGTPLPQNVSNICAWTHMCDSSGLTIHFNDAGEIQVANAFDQTIDQFVFNLHRSMVWSNALAT
jgi:lysophospholipase L1-like esterase